MTQLDQNTIEILNQEFLGKRILVQTKKGNFAGVCKFIGHNEFFPSWELQVTIDRTPVTNVEIKNIGLVEDTRLFNK